MAQVTEKSVQLIPIGTSGKNLVLTLDKAGLKDLHQGSIHTLEFQLNGEMVKLVVMRDTVFAKKAKMLHTLNDQAKQSAEMEVQINKELGVGESKIIL